MNLLKTIIEIANKLINSIHKLLVVFKEVKSLFGVKKEASTVSIQRASFSYSDLFKVTGLSMICYLAIIITKEDNEMKGLLIEIIRKYFL